KPALGEILRQFFAGLGSADDAYSNLVLRSLKLRPRMRLKPRISVLFSGNAKSNCCNGMILLGCVVNRFFEKIFEAIFRQSRR
ncbi:MAG: hypothetical protein FWE20_03170, partial [Defluviitaleaceae bacterium]|nr:hypothetical protein [Defluviitaleaceae bacterium]